MVVFICMIYKRDSITVYFIKDKMLIQILGAWCPTCEHLYILIKEISKELDFDSEIERIDDAKAISQYGVATLPALIADNLLVFAWSIPEKNELIDILQDIHAQTNHDCCGWSCGTDDGCCGWSCHHED